MLDKSKKINKKQQSQQKKFKNKKQLKQGGQQKGGNDKNIFSKPDNQQQQKQKQQKKGGKQHQQQKKLANKKNKKQQQKKQEEEEQYDEEEELNEEMIQEEQDVQLSDVDLQEEKEEGEQEENDIEFEEEQEQEQEQQNKVKQQQQQQQQQQQKQVQQQLMKNVQSKICSKAIYTGGKIIASHDENFLFSSCNFEITKYDINTRQIVDKIVHTDEEIANFAIHPTDKYIATFCRNFLLRLINLETKEVMHTWKVMDHFALDMQFDPSGKFIAIGCVNGAIKIFDCKKGSESHSYKVHRGSVTKLLFHPHKAKYQLASAGDDFSIKIYDLRKSKCLVSLNGHKSQINSILYTEKGTNLISGGEQIIVWDLVKMKQQASIQYEEEIECLSYFSLKHYEGNQGTYKNYLLVSGNSGIFKTIDISSDEVQVKSFKQFKTHEILKIIRLKNRHQIVMVSSEQFIFIYDLTYGPTLRVNDIVVGFNDEITDAKFRKVKKQGASNFNIDEEQVIVASNSNILKAVNLSDQKTQLLMGHTDIILSVDTFEDYIISASKDKTVRLWKKLEKVMPENFEYLGEAERKSYQYQLIQKNKVYNNYFGSDYMCVAVYHGHIEDVSSIAISPKTGRFFASCSSDNTLKLWDIHTVLQKASDDSENYALQNIKTSMHTVVAHEKDINSVKIAPNEKFIASASQDRSIKIWRAENLSSYLTMKGHKRGIWDIAFSPVEQVLASASGDQTVKIWNLQDGQCLHTLEGHIGSVLKVQWISHGLQLVSAGGDSLMKIWNVKKESCINTIENHEGKIWALDSSNYNKHGKQYILSGANDSEFNIYEDITAEEQAKKKEEEHQIIIEQQNFNSFIREKDYIGAAKLAFKQNFTKNFYKSLSMLFSALDFQNSIIFQDFDVKVKVNEEHCQEQEQKIQEMVEYFVSENFSRLLVFIRDMNVSQKHSKVAGKMLNLIFNIVPLDDIMEMKKKFQIVNRKKEVERADFNQLLEALELYSVKHMERQERFIKKSYYLDFVINKIDAMALNIDSQEGEEQQQQNLPNMNNTILQKSQA